MSLQGHFAKAALLKAIFGDPQLMGRLEWVWVLTPSLSLFHASVCLPGVSLMADDFRASPPTLVANPPLVFLVKTHLLASQSPIQ
jgi:hypothetical protein